jgi:diketogulonate reductase-like aldo/keto reductase
MRLFAHCAVSQKQSFGFPTHTVLITIFLPRGKVSAVNSLKYLIQRIETTVKAERPIRIRPRATIVRIQITETRIRAIVRIGRQEGTPDRRHPYFVLR